MERFILKIPKWNGAIAFDYETVMWILTIAMLFGGLALCMLGYRYFKTLCILVLGCGSAAVGMLLTEQMTRNAVVKMFVCVVFTFFCVCLLHLLSMLIASITKGLHIRVLLTDKSYLTAAVLGAAVAGVTVYLRIYRSALLAAALFLVLAVLGAWHGKRKAAARRPFYTYEDLLLLNRHTGSGKEAEHD